MTERYITPSKITAWLDCAHFLSLKHQVEDGVLKVETGGPGSFAQLLMDKGAQHEAACLAELEAEGRTVLRIEDRDKREKFSDWVTRIGNPFDTDVDVIFQMPLIHNGIRGIADFLVRVKDADGGTTWEPVDAKLARQEAKPGHVLQPSFYAHAIEASTCRRPEQIPHKLEPGSRENLRVSDVAA